ncbi:MAG: hypothetical protein ACYDEJ_17300 [Desulfitobacteriaceae bacterium]
MIKEVNPIMQWLIGRSLPDRIYCSQIVDAGYSWFNVFMEPE